jgi:ribosome biogenesis GTPase / thiamine phosphate phosphatase
MRATNPIAVGDKVEITREADGTGSIEDIHDRKNYVIRKSVNLSKEVHVIAANLDQAIIVATVEQPRTSLGFIDRFLCVAEAYGIPAMVVLNKSDLIIDEKSKKLTQVYIETYAKAGYPIFQVSAETGDGIESLLKQLTDKTTLIFGHSGVGKSTLLNTIEPNLDLKTGDISEVHHKGKHTTTFAEMFELSGGGFVIDTPGVKEFGMIDMGIAEISHYFPEIFRTSDKCKFGNCLHRNEPNCAVRNAVENEDIPESRYSSYISILESIE